MNPYAQKNQEYICRSIAIAYVFPQDSKDLDLIKIGSSVGVQT